MSSASRRLTSQPREPVQDDRRRASWHRGRAARRRGTSAPPGPEGTSCSRAPVETLRLEETSAARPASNASPAWTFDRHQLLVEPPVKELLAVRPPVRVGSAGRRDLPRPPGTGIALHVDLVAARLVRDVGDEACRRERTAAGARGKESHGKRPASLRRSAEADRMSQFVFGSWTLIREETSRRAKNSSESGMTFGLQQEFLLALPAHRLSGRYPSAPSRSEV